MGQQVTASVLYADISGFTAISEKLDPEEVTTVMNRCFESLEAVVIAHGGTPIQYLGDCILAVFGLAGEAEELTTSAAVQAALELRAALYQYNKEAQLPSVLDVHIGVATGLVFASEVGGRVHRELTVSGGTVQLASRLEDVSDRGQIFVGPRTEELTRAQYNYRPVATVQVGESPDPVQVYELLGIHEAHRRRKRDSERRQASVLFAEVIGFKKLAETLPSPELSDLLNRCLTVLETAVVDQGGVIDKYIGPGVMALFGVPNAIEDAPQKALNAAIEMRNGVQRFNLEEKLPVELQIHVGVNSGLVIAGEIGGRVRRTFTVMGDTVNVSSRLKDAAGAGAIYVGPETCRTTQDVFDLQPVEPLRLKGKAQPLAARALMSTTQKIERSHPAQELATFSAPLIGREQELASLRAQLRRLADGHGGVTCISGEAGLGKSRLIREALARESDATMRVLEAPCVSIGATLVFHPFARALRTWCELGAEDPGVQLAKMQKATAAILDEEVEEVVPFLALLLGIAIDGEAAQRIAAMDGEAREKLMFQSVRRLFEGIASQGPTLLWIDDLHWVDASSVSLLEFLLPLSKTVPLHFLLAYRPDFEETAKDLLDPLSADGRSEAVAVQLTALSNEDAVKLTESLLRIDNLPIAARRRITERAEGNPFYLEQLVRSLVDQGAIEPVGDHCRVTDKLETVVMPGTVQEVILSRVDRLDEPARHLLQIASIIGRSFYPSIMQQILQRQGEADDQMAHHLGTLLDKQLLGCRAVERGARAFGVNVADDIEYVFPHALAQHAVYESLLLKTRRELHRLVAQSIEDRFADHLSGVYGMLAYHYSQTEDLGKAEEYLFKAGEVAANSAASRDALNLFREASRLYLQLHADGGDPRKHILLEKNIAIALWNCGELTESIQHFDKTLELLGVRAHEGALRRNLAFALDFAAVLYRLFTRPAMRVDDLERERDIIDIAYMKGRAQTTSDPTRVFMDSVAGIRRLNRTDPSRIERAAGMYATMAAFLTYSGASFGLGGRFLDRARQVQRPNSIIDSFSYQSMRYIHTYLAGDWHEIEVLPPDLVADAVRSGLLWDVQTYLGLDCDRRLRQGDFAGAQQCLAELGEIAETYGYEFARSNRAGMTAILLLEQRSLPEAAKAAETYCSERHEDSLKVLALGTKAKVEILLGDIEDAAATLERARSVIARAQIIPPWHFSAYTIANLKHALRMLRRAQVDGDRQELNQRTRAAKQGCRQALAIAAKVRTQSTEAHRLAGDLAWLLGKKRAAIRSWSKSISEGHRIGARPELARTYLSVATALQAESTTEVLGLTPAQCAEEAAQLFDLLGLSPDGTSAA